MTIKERFEGITERLTVLMPDASTELDYPTTWGLLVAVVLSAQCTDKRVNMVTPALLAAYPTPAHMAKANPEEIFSYIRSISYPNSKANNLHRTATILAREYSNQVPHLREQLESLPGVGRKTANVMLSVAFGQPAMAVDTHVLRVSRRIGLSKGTTPLAVENDLVKHFDQSVLSTAHHWLILHGRYVCTARAPQCDNCGLQEFCKFYGTKK